MKQQIKNKNKNFLCSKKTFLYFCSVAKLKKINKEIDFVINPTQQGMLLPVLIDLTYRTGLTITEILLLLHLADKKKVGRAIVVNEQKFGTVKLYQTDYLEFVGNGTYAISQKGLRIIKEFEKQMNFKEKYVRKKNLSVEDKLKNFLSD